MGFHGRIPRNSPPPRPGRPRPQSRRNPRPNPCTAVEERRFSAASSPPKASRASAPVDVLNFGSATIRKGTPSVPSQAPKQFCHSERSRIIREADDLAKSRNLLFACATPPPSLLKFAPATTGKGTTSVVPKATKKRNESRQGRHRGKKSKLCHPEQATLRPLIAQLKHDFVLRKLNLFIILIARQVGINR